jgi:viroplasmin and RNaseH domain-containing protein
MGEYLVLWEVVIDYKGNTDEKGKRFNTLEEAEKFMEKLKLEENCNCWID